MSESTEKVDASENVPYTMPTEISSQGKNLRFPVPKQQARFEVGLASAIFLWDDLQTAVDNEWGGPESADKREWMVGTVIDLFDEQNSITADEIEFRLLAIMEDEFDVTLETNTALIVAQTILGMWLDCSQGDFRRIDEYYQRFQAQQNRAKNKVVVKDLTAPDSSDEGSDEDDQGSDDEMKDVEETPKQGPIIDDDGFELVQKKRR